MIQERPNGSWRKPKFDRPLPEGQGIVARHEFDVKVERWFAFREAIHQVIESDNARVGSRPLLRIFVRLMPVAKKGAGIAMLMGKHETAYERTPRAIVELEYASITDYLSARSSPDGRMIWDMHFGPGAATSATLVSINLIEPC